MRKLYLKLFLASFPILFVLSVYFIQDPFKVLYHYSSYFPTDGTQPVVLNKDYISTEMFIQNYPRYHYDSYIFGNSRSMYYAVAEWEKHIHAGKCFHFDASGEGLYGIERKLNYLNEQKVPIRNALIVFDQSVCTIVKNQGETHLFKKHPVLSGQTWLDFQTDCLKAFFDVDFLSSYLKYLFTHKVSHEMVEKLLLDDVPIHYDPVINEISYPVFESDISRNRDSFYQARSKIFYSRDTVQRYAPQTIREEQLKLFRHIRDILVENNTDYRFVISPMYDQVKFNPGDLQILYGLFGKDRVFDFSGINSITANMYNYYENSHYRPFIANRIMDSIYSEHAIK